MNLIRTMIAMVCLVQAALAGDMYGFTVTQPKEGWIGSADGELRFFTGPIQPGRPEYLVWTADSKQDRVQLWREPVTGDLKKKYLAIDQAAETLQLRLQADPVPTQWKWNDNGQQVEGRIAHLEVAKGKFQGQFLGIEDELIDFAPKDGRKPYKVYKLKMVEKPDTALTFRVYVVAP